MKEMKVDWGLLTETEATDGVYTRFSLDYWVYATEAASPHQGGVALFFAASSDF